MRCRRPRAMGCETGHAESAPTVTAPVAFPPARSQSPESGSPRHPLPGRVPWARVPEIQLGLPLRRVGIRPGIGSDRRLRRTVDHHLGLPPHVGLERAAWDARRAAVREEGRTTRPGSALAGLARGKTADGARADAYQAMRPSNPSEGSSGRSTPKPLGTGRSSWLPVLTPTDLHSPRLP